MNRRDNGVTVMNTPRRAFGELKNIAYGGTPRSIDNIKARSNVLNNKVFSDDPPVKKVLLSVSNEIPPGPRLHKLKKADSLEELCDIAAAKRSFAVYNDSDSEVEAFGGKDDSFKDSCVEREVSIILTEDDNADLLGNTLSTIEEIDLNDFEEDCLDDESDADDLEVEVPFAGGMSVDFDDFTHIPEDLVLNDNKERSFYCSSYTASDEENEYESGSDEESEITHDQLRSKEATLAEIMTRVHFDDFVC